MVGITETHTENVEYWRNLRSAINNLEQQKEQIKLELNEIDRQLSLLRMELEALQ